jgi:hypothetical protein
MPGQSIGENPSMKITFISLTAVATLLVAPLAQASDKEVQNARCPKACQRKNQQQVALFVSGRGVAEQPASPMQTVSHAQVGQGNSITFFTGYR